MLVLIDLHMFAMYLSLNSFFRLTAVTVISDDSRIGCCFGASFVRWKLAFDRRSLKKSNVYVTGYSLTSSWMLALFFLCLERPACPALL